MPPCWPALRLSCWQCDVSPFVCSGIGDPAAGWGPSSSRPLTRRAPCGGPSVISTILCGTRCEPGPEGSILILGHSPVKGTGGPVAARSICRIMSRYDDMPPEKLEELRRMIEEMDNTIEVIDDDTRELIEKRWPWLLSIS